MMAPPRPVPAATPARPDFRLIARFLVRADDPVTADRLQARLLDALHTWAAAPQAPPAPYWKEEGSFDISLLLHPANVASFDRVLGLAGKSWWVSRDDECSAVWNPEPGYELIDPAVFWAELILCHAEAAEAPPDADSGS
jgi:plasmid stabilization system protein ParE